jgi:hypothetical protein
LLTLCADGAAALMSQNSFLNTPLHMLFGYFYHHAYEPEFDALVELATLLLKTAASKPVTDACTYDLPMHARTTYRCTTYRCMHVRPTALEP